LIAVWFRINEDISPTPPITMPSHHRAQHPSGEGTRSRHGSSMDEIFIEAGERKILLFEDWSI